MILFYDYLICGLDCVLLYLNMLIGFCFKMLKLEVIYVYLLLLVLVIFDNSVI